MTSSFLPRPSPDHRDAFECDASGHLLGQNVHPLLNHADQGGYGGGGSNYICMYDHGTKNKGQYPGLLISNQYLSYPRAANARKSPSPVSCFIPFTNAPPTIGGIALPACYYSLC